MRVNSVLSLFSNKTLLFPDYFSVNSAVGRTNFRKLMKDHDSAHTSLYRLPD